MSMNTNKERRWDSADMFSSLESGKKYNITAAGFRVPFFSIFPNIMEAKQVD